jgi:hypothetical protein
MDTDWSKSQMVSLLYREHISGKKGISMVTNGEIYPQFISKNKGGTRMTEETDRDLITESLPVQLTTEEVLFHSKELAKLNADAVDLENQKKEVNTQFTADAKRIQAQMNSHAVAINNGYEYRPVKCYWEFDWEAGTKSLIRTDTYEIVRKTTISAQEKQGRLDDEAEKKEYVLDRDKKMEPVPTIVNVFVNGQPYPEQPCIEGEVVGAPALTAGENVTTDGADTTDKGEVKQKTTCTPDWVTPPGRCRKILKCEVSEAYCCKDCDNACSDRCPADPGEQRP